MEVRPGLFFGGDLFNGIEAGMYLRYSFLQKYFVFSGVNLHFNEGAGHGTARVIFTKDDTYTLIGFGIGVKANSLNFAFSYYLPLNNNLGYIANEYRLYTTRLFGVYKLGLEIYIL